MNASRDNSESSIPIGELKARYRDEHLCLRCGHRVVCKVAKVLDPGLLVTISRCLALQPVDDEANQHT